jgi:hypothetical protein
MFISKEELKNLKIDISNLQNGLYLLKKKLGSSEIKYCDKCKHMTIQIHEEEHLELSDNRLTDKPESWYCLNCGTRWNNILKIEEDTTKESGENG